MSGGPSGMWDIQPATPGFLIASAVAVTVSLLTPEPSRAVVDLFDRVNSREAVHALGVFDYSMLFELNRDHY